MFKHMTTIAVAVVMLTACAGEKSPKVTSLQKRDKNLSCSEVQLEINEAEFYRKTAEQNKNPKIKSLIMPLGYISTYVDAEEASNAADARIEYLNRIYDILNCDSPQAHQRSARYDNVGYGGQGGGTYQPNPVRYVPQDRYYRDGRPSTVKPVGTQSGIRNPDMIGVEEWYW